MRDPSRYWLLITGAFVVAAGANVWSNDLDLLRDARCSLPRMFGAANGCADLIVLAERADGLLCDPDNGRLEVKFIVKNRGPGDAGPSMTNVAANPFGISVARVSWDVATGPLPAGAEVHLSRQVASTSPTSPCDYGCIVTITADSALQIRERVESNNSLTTASVHDCSH